MRARKWAAYAAGVTMIVLSAASTAQGQVVTFSGITDAVASRFFDAATSAPDPLDANRLIIGLNTGIDWTTWKATDFRASSGAYSYTTAMDTISFVIDAPEGFYISRVTYTQRGTGSVARTGSAAGGANWVVGDYAGNLGVHGPNPTLSRTLDLTGRNITMLPMSITCSLFAFSTIYLGSATVAITGADVRVELLPLPVTP